MSILYGRYFTLEVESLSEATRALSQRYSVNSVEYKFLLKQFTDAFFSGGDWPTFEDGGALVQLKPSLAYRLSVFRTTTMPTKE